MSEHPSRLPLVLFGLLLGLCVVLALVFVIEEVPFEERPSAAGGTERVATGHGTPHPRFPSMDRGGSGVERHRPILWLGWLFGLLQLALIVGCLALGVGRDRDRVRGPLAAVGLVLAAIFTMMVVTYRAALEVAASPLLFSLPAPTAWFLYGLWPAQFLVVLLYVWVFSRSIVTPRDMDRFRRILADRDRRQTSEP